MNMDEISSLIGLDKSQIILLIKDKNIKIDCGFAESPGSIKIDRKPSLTDHFFKICFNLSVSEKDISLIGQEFFLICKDGSMQGGHFFLAHLHMGIELQFAHHGFIVPLLKT